MHEFVKPNKCIMIEIYFSATNKGTTDKTLKVWNESTQVLRDCQWETYHTKE